MKKLLLTFVIPLFCTATYAQNTFPTTGNVGIGTTTPGSKLNIVHQAESSDKGALIIGNGSVPNLRFGYNTTYSWIQSHGAAPLYINELGNNLILNRSSGNVGIGTVNPTEKLAVNGTIRAKEIKVETANWPDYVFGEDYKIRSLTEIGEFIRVNKHLPGIPNKKEVEEEGINLGEMNRKLLEKVEELTLHLIEKDKLLTDVVKRLEQLEYKQQ